MGARCLGGCSVETRQGSGDGLWSSGEAGAVEGQGAGQIGCSGCGVDRQDRDHTGCDNVRLGGNRGMSSEPEGGAVLNDEGEKAGA